MLCDFEKIDNGIKCKNCGKTVISEFAHIHVKSACKAANKQQIAKNALKSAIGFVKSGAKLASPEERSRRIRICEGCSHYINKKCKLCGCYASFKAKIDGESCPVNKW